MTNKPQRIAVFTLLAAAWLVLAVIWAGVFVIEKHDHEHINSAGSRVPTGENCRICLEMQIALRLIEALGRLGVCVAAAGFIIYALSFVKPQSAFNLYNPIALKVQFNC